MSRSWQNYRAQLIEQARFARFEDMPESALEQVRQSIELLYRVDSGRILATLIRLLGDFDLAEDSMHEAFAAALDLWHKTGIPANPRPWLISTARFKAIDTMRRRVHFDASQRDLILHLEAQSVQQPQQDEGIEDDRLRLIFICCHPSIPPEAHVALTLREVCGLTTGGDQRERLSAPSANTGAAGSIVRAQGSNSESKGLDFQMPLPSDLPDATVRRAPGHLPGVQ